VASDIADAATSDVRDEHLVPDGEASQAAEIADAIASLIHSYQNLKSRVASSLDPEVASLFLLVKLVKGGPRRAKELAEAMCADQSTVSRHVAALVKSGLIDRQADPDDGRASILVPTQPGRDRVRELLVTRGHGVESIISDWHQPDRDQFLRLLRKYNCTLENKRDEVISSMTRGHSLRLAPPSQGPQSPAQHRIERSN